MLPKIILQCILNNLFCLISCAGKRHDIESLSIDRVLNNIFMKNSFRKCTPKASPRPLFNLIFVNNPKQPLHAGNSFNNNIF